MALSVTGSGCPKSTAIPRPSLDNTYFDINYTAMTAEAGKGAPTTSYRVTCIAAVQLFEIPAGYRFSVTGVSLHGATSLSGGSIARLDMRAWYAGTPLPAATRQAIGDSGEWDLDLPLIADSPDCDPLHVVNLSTDIRVSQPTNRALWSMITLVNANRFSERFHIAWHKC
jgi:hypothetical protein